jgi:alpha-D-ribose 1-methylphosphonate 5-triphosphate synthase subunit PhnG
MSDHQTLPEAGLSLEQQNRRHWLSVLAKANPDRVASLFATLPIQPEWTAIRLAESGMVMVRGRVGGDGNRFNMGEMTMTRSAVRLANGITGLGFVQGRSRGHAEATAVLDAMLQTPELSEMVANRVIEPLALEQTEARDLRARKAAATKVEFFTMVRGEG